MSAAATPDATPPRSRGRLLVMLAPLVLGAIGFASTYLGYWSPALLLGPPRQEAGASISTAVFVDVPGIELNIPGSGGRQLILSAVIETDGTHSQQVSYLMPRVRDAFFGFLSGIDPAAYDKRGVLEVIRTEMVTRSRFVLGQDAVNDLLITEFRIR